MHGKFKQLLVGTLIFGTPVMIFGFALPAFHIQGFGPAVLGPAPLHAQPVGEEDEDTGAVQPSFGGKRGVVQFRSQRLEVQPKRGGAGTTTRDHRSVTTRGTRRSGGMVEQSHKPGVAYATSSIKCDDGTVYEVSTGNDQGACDTDTSDGEPSGIRCRDGEGNRAQATCMSGCIQTKGSGSCKVKQ